MNPSVFASQVTLMKTLAPPATTFDDGSNVIEPGWAWATPGSANTAIAVSPNASTNSRLRMSVPPVSSDPGQRLSRKAHRWTSFGRTGATTVQTVVVQPTSAVQVRIWSGKSYSPSP